MIEHVSTSALVAGGCAGLSVDLALFPLDTLKTRIQSKQGLLKSGGFRGVYSGLPSVAVGSVPGAALFFFTYETVKSVLSQRLENQHHALPLVHMTAAACGEVVACLVRVPTEVVKQRTQAQAYPTTRAAFMATLQGEGVLGFYRGYVVTIFREIPFAFIQFPLWEMIKDSWKQHQGHPVEPWQSSVAGAISGGTAGALTTPLDVAKTRIMLAQVGTAEAKGNILQTLQIVFSESGYKGLFAGLSQRVLWISVGGAIFLGIYDMVRVKLFHEQSSAKKS